MARQAALLLLAIHDYEIPDGPVSNDFYRQALELDLRGKREYTDVCWPPWGESGRCVQPLKSVELSDEG
jgi:hypothetical protein